MAQYVGLSDVLGRLVTELPNYAYRFGRFLLHLLRRVVANPVGFVTIVTGIALGTYMVDKWFDGLLTSLQAQVQSTINYISQGILSINTPPCSLSNILGCVEGALIDVVKFIVNNVFGTITNAFLTLVAYIVAGIKYVVEWHMYVVCYVLCTYIQPMFSTVSAGYVGARVISSLWRMAHGRPGRLIMTPILGVGTAFVTYAVAKSFLDYVLYIIGIQCNPQVQTCREPPPLQLTLYQVTPPPTPKQGVSITESVSYSLNVGSTQLQKLLISTKEGVGYSLGLARAPKLTLSASEYVLYSLLVRTPQQSSLVLRSTESTSYVLSPSKPLSLGIVTTEVGKYSLSVGVTTVKPSACQCTSVGCICSEAVSSALLAKPPVVVSQSVSTSAG